MDHSHARHGSGTAFNRHAVDVIGAESRIVPLVMAGTDPSLRAARHELQEIEAVLPTIHLGAWGGRQNRHALAPVRLRLVQVSVEGQIESPPQASQKPADSGARMRQKYFV